MPEPDRTQKSPDETEVKLHQLMLPEHANAFGNVHGGLIMKMVDEAAAIAAMRHAQRPCVTVAIDSMMFHSPVHVGELLSCVARVTYTGRTSIEVGVRVHAEDITSGRVTHTNSAYLVYVALGDDGRPHPVPRLEVRSEEQQRAWAEALQRQEHRLRRRGQP